MWNVKAVMTNLTVLNVAEKISWGDQLAFVCGGNKGEETTVKNKKYYQSEDK